MVLTATAAGPPVLHVAGHLEFFYVSPPQLLPCRSYQQAVEDEAEILCLTDFSMEPGTASGDCEE